MDRKQLKSASLEDIAAQAICPNCGASVERKSARGRAPKYCSPKCGREMAARDLNRGKALITAFMGWIDAPPGSPLKKEAFKEMNSIGQIFKEEDARAGRPSASLPAAKMLADGYRYMDRRRS